MKVYQKLQLIQKISGLTQEKLAKKLEVSFVTLNRWINNKSIPHKRKEEKIDVLYKEYTGLGVVSDDVLQAKKDIIEKKKKEHKNVLRKILSSPDIYDEFKLSLTYNSNSIEGNTLTKDETADVLFRDISLPNKKLVEQLEAKNHQTALKYAFSYVAKKNRVDEKFVLKLHSILMNSIREDAGIYRNHPVLIVGANIPTANYLKVPDLMENLIRRINKPKKDGVKKIAIIHSEFEQIHPFSDGNGRAGRLLMNAMFLKDNIAPAVIQQEERRKYIVALHKSQDSGDTSLLEDFICDSILEGYKIVERDGII